VNIRYILEVDGQMISEFASENKALSAASLYLGCRCVLYVYDGSILQSSALIVQGDLLA